MVEEKVKDYENRLRQRVGEGEYERHKELVRLLARNLTIEDLLWEEILVSIRDVDARTELLRQRNQIVRDIHTEFRALNIEIPTLVEQKTENFMNFLGDLEEDVTSEEPEGNESSSIGEESV
jgi:hypothetical protein|tara:strand:+ start:494 stop:859 length:366 start_codon:yes stop_codon:yes gene_type:complete